MAKRALDDIDRRLLLLQANARKLGLSRSAVQARIERLERTGVVRGYGVRLGPDPADGAMRAHVLLSVDPKQQQRVVRALEALPEVRACHTLSGVHDLLATVAAETPSEMDALIDRIGAVPGVQRTTTSIVLATKFERG